ncbi:hypothetical protein GCM10028832_28060 [Streptomyces sparsus]
MAGRRRRKNLIDDLLDRTDDASRDMTKVVRRALTGRRKKRKGGARKWAKRNNEALEALALQLDRYIKHDREMAQSGSKE